MSYCFECDKTVEKPHECPSGSVRVDAPVSMACPDCGNSMSDTERPNEWVISIPFTRVEIRIWRWVNEKFCTFCNTETDDNYDSMMEDAYNEGLNDGYEEAFDKYAEPY